MLVDWRRKFVPSSTNRLKLLPEMPTNMTSGLPKTLIHFVDSSLIAAQGWMSVQLSSTQHCVASSGIVTFIIASVLRHSEINFDGCLNFCSTLSQCSQLHLRTAKYNVLRCTKLFQKYIGSSPILTAVFWLPINLLFFSYLISYCYVYVAFKPLAY